jgi:hypothetical protein
MIAMFQVGDREKHRIEVEQPFIGRKMTVKVDNAIVAEHVSPPQSFVIKFSCGKEEVHHVQIRINYFTFKYEAYLDGQIVVGCLFPQAVAYNAFGLALMAFVLAVWQFFSSLRG